MKKGDIVICHKAFIKDGEKLLTKGNKYHHSYEYTYEGDNRAFITSTTNKKYKIIEFYVHKPSLMERIKRRIDSQRRWDHNTIYPVNRKYFSDYFYTKKDIRKLKLKKLKNV